MRLTLCSFEAQPTHESDYDTAVDLVHYSELRVCYALQLPSGARLAVERTESSTSRSYLEPDFDLLDAGGPLVYEQHASGDDAQQAVYHRVELDPLVRLRALSAEDWAHAQADGHGEDFDGTMFLLADEAPLSAHGPCVASAQLFDAVERLNLATGQSFDAALLGEEFVRWAETLDEQVWALNGHNLQARIDSRCGLAKYRLQRWLANWSAPQPS